MRRLSIYAALILIALVVVFPIVWIIMQSLKKYFDIIAYPPKLLFKPTLKNYQEVFATKDFLRAFVNSLIVAVTSVSICIAIGAPFGYVLARYRFRGSKDIGFFVFSTRMMPAIVVIVPLIRIFGLLKMIDTYMGLVLTHILLNIALVVWMTRGFFIGIPKEIEEAAWIDGCSYMKAFFRIIFPVAAPGIVSTAILAFMFSWNELLFALTIAGDKVVTLPVFMGTHYHGYIAVSYGPLSASGIISVIPTITFLILVRKNIVRGLSFGAIK